MYVYCILQLNNDEEIFECDFLGHVDITLIVIVHSAYIHIPIVIEAHNQGGSYEICMQCMKVCIYLIYIYICDTQTFTIFFTGM